MKSAEKLTKIRTTNHIYYANRPDMISLLISNWHLVIGNWLPLIESPPLPLQGASQFCIYSASLRARELYNTRVLKLAL